MISLIKVNYARYLSAYFAEMMNLPEKNSKLERNYTNSRFVFKNNYSCLARPVSTIQRGLHQGRSEGLEPHERIFIVVATVATVAGGVVKWHCGIQCGQCGLGGS